jgi:DNA-binding response OmpR family regulator
VIKIARIFIVDDDRTIVYLFEELLRMEGHEVVSSAFDGDQAVTIYQNMHYPPDIILMDYRMPKKDGLLVSKEILAIDPKSTIIFISADTSVKSQALSMGAVAFLEKPFSFRELLTAINEVLPS